MPISEEIMSDNKKIITKNIFGIGLIALALYFLVRAFFLSLSTDIWYDELFSMEFAGRCFNELIGLTARDVHPPLYYMIVRVFLLLLGGTGLESEEIAKMVSILPFLLLIIYAVTIIRKNFGLLTSGLFSLAIVSMPGLPEYTTEIRMYSFAMFFVTAALIHSFNLMSSYMDSDRKWDVLNGCALFIYGTAAAYTHYYAALSVGIIYGFTLIWMIKRYIDGIKKSVKTKVRLNFKSLALMIICMNFTAIAYIPWLSALFGQVSTVSGSYWIQPVGLRTFGSCIKYLFSGYFSNGTVTIIVAVILFALAAFLAIHNIYRLVANKYEEDNAGIKDVKQMIAFWILPAVSVVGIVASILIRPVFVNRYLIPSIGTFYLAISIGIGQMLSDANTKKIIKAVYCTLMVLIVIVGCVDFKGFIGNEEYRQVNMEKTLELFSQIDDDTIIISNFDQVQALLAYYLNSGKYSDNEYKIYLYYSEPETLIDEMLTGLYTIEDSVDVENYLLSGKKVWFLGSFNSREVILDEWNQDYGIKSDNLGSYLMERYWFDVFELKL